MELSSNKVNVYVKRLTDARTRLLCTNGFYGLLITHVKFALDETIGTACTDGEKILFAPQFLDDITDKELDFVLMHEILHIVLQHCTRGKGKDERLFNIACDIVVNSNVLYSNGMNLKSITLKKHGVAMHLTPKNEEGYLYTAEQVYEMLKKLLKKDADEYKGWDSHEAWGVHGETSKVYEDWIQRFKDVCATMENRNQGFHGSGNALPFFAERLLNELKNPQVDWRTILNDFLQEDVSDYSFSPPDKRFQDSPFLLPDFNEITESVKDIMFFVDTSASIGTSELTSAYSEIKGLIEQFNGRFQGKIAFFDASVKEPIRNFEDVSSLLSIKPVGGGGTSFSAIFKYIKKKLSSELPAVIVILTDGCAPFPKEEVAMGIPTLWIINNDKVTPPWGRIARIKVDD